MRELIGERLVVGLSGIVATDEDLATLEETRARGVILYRRNYEDPEQLATLLGRLREVAGPLLVTTDHEGGRVIMLGRGTTIFPDNLAMGRAGSAEEAARQGAIEARELRRLGVDVNLGPCLDVLTSLYSPNIGIRAYGEDPAVVASLGVARLTASQKGGVSACAKHFPGKGHSPLDAHLRLPTIESSAEEMRSVHLPPFIAAIEAGVDAIMTSHPIYARFETRGLDPVPATFSRPIVTGLLREELGFQGVIVSDDLEMGAVNEVSPVGEAAVRAVRAGHDLLLVCHTSKAQREAARALVRAYETGELPREELEPAAARCRALREKARPAGEGAAAPEAGADALARSIAERAVRVVRGDPTSLDGNVAVIFPRFSDLAARITIEPEVQDERAFLARAFAGSRVVPDVTLVGILEPTDAEIALAAERAAASPSTVLFLYDARLYPKNRALLDAVQARARKLIVVLLRDPWDAELLRPGVAAITAFGWRRCQLEALLARLVR